MTTGRMLLLICLVYLTSAATVEDQRVAIALLHRRGPECNGNETSLSALQREAAAQWACQIINNQTNPHLFSIDVLAIDSCGDADIAVKRALRIVKQSQLIPILGVIALEDAEVLAEAAKVLRRHQIPLVLATPKSSEALLYTDPSAFLEPNNVFSAVPNTAAVARATMAVAKGIQGTSIRILGSCPLTIRAAARAAKQLQIKVTSEEQWLANYSSVSAFLDSLPLLTDEETENSPHMVALLMEPSELQAFMAQALRKTVGRRITWLLGCIGTIDPHTAAQWTLSLTTSAFLIEPHLLELAGLSDYLQSQDVAPYPIDNEIPHIVQAVSALGAAFHLQELANCQAAQSDNDQGTITCHPERLSNPAVLPSQMLSALRQLSLPQTESDNLVMSSPRQLEGTSNHFTPSGRLVANRYLIQKLMAATGESSPVAWYSDDDGLVLAAVMTSQSNGRFYFFNHASSGPLLSSVAPFSNVEDLPATATEEADQVDEHQPPPSAPSIAASADDDGEVVAESSDAITSTPHWGRPIVHVHGRTWSAAIVALAATELLAVLYVLSVIGARLCDGSLRGAHHGLAVLLLVALAAELSSVVLYVLPSSQQSVCQLKVYLPPVTLAAAFAVLLAKLLHLRHSSGEAGQVPPPQSPLYLAVVLSVAVQAAVSAHFDDCSVDLPLLYLFQTILVSVTAIYAASLPAVRRRHAEAGWILWASAASSAVLLGWAAACAWLLPVDYHDGATAALLVVLAAVMLGCVFVPVMAQLRPLKAAAAEASASLGNAEAALAGAAPQSYACNIAVASIVANPWLDKSCFSQEKQTSISSSSTTSQQLSGSQLMRHPAYITGRP